MKEEIYLIKELQKETGISIIEYPELNKIVYFEKIPEPLSAFEDTFSEPKEPISYSLDNEGNVNCICINEIDIKNYDTLSQFKNLNCIILHAVPIQNASFLSNIKKLKQLLLVDTKIKDISFVSKLPQLTWFVYNSDYATDISALKGLKQLILLFLEVKNSESFDFSFLKELLNLRALGISHMSVSDLSFLKNLRKLQDLDLSNNKIANISNIENLTKLIELNLSNNKITNISNIENLKNIFELDLSYNKIFDISEIKLSPSIRKINLQKNKITNIPKQLFDLGLDLIYEFKDKYWHEIESGINISDNPIEVPPIEIIKKGKYAIFQYYKSIEGEKASINEVKVILIGDGGCGKTSLVKQILGEHFDISEEQTHGINIRDWNASRNGENITVHFWDFGGQEIMHATHQFFLSKRSLYILVLDGRKDEKTEYWLKHIESFGGDSPILVVLNKIDQNPAFEVNRKFLKEKYIGIKGFFRISCAEHFGIDDFTKNLIDELSNIKILATTWPKSWFNVKSELEKIEDSFISYGEFKIICEKEKINEELSQDTLVEFLNDLGVVIHFKDIQLLDTHVLEPKWVTQAVYKIINSNELAKERGILKTELLNKILKKRNKNDYFYPPDKYRFIIDLMMKFELCYEIDSRTILIPDLLEIQEPDYKFDIQNSLKFVIEFDFLPKSVLPRFMVRMNNDIMKGFNWRTGVLLEYVPYNSRALIRADERDKKVFIYVDGEQKRDYFSNIRKTFKDINNSFEKVKTTELVPLPDNKDFFIEYEELIAYELTKRKKIFIGKLRKEYNVSELLNGIEKEEERRKKYKEDRDGKIIHIQDSNVTITEKEYKDMSKNIIKIGDGATFHGDFMVGNKIKDSFNKAESSNASEELKELLKTLSVEVAKMTEEMPKEQAEQVANDLQTLTNEATSEKPRRKWYELSAEGLKDAAKTVGEVGVSVAKTIAKITPILASIL